MAGETVATTSIPDGAWQVAALALAGAGDVDGDPWGGGWRLNAPARLCLAADGPDGPEERAVEPASATSAPEVSHPAIRLGDHVHVSVGGRSVPFRLAPPPELARTASLRGSAGSESATDLVAPMPGTVLGVHVAVGASVEAGDPVATLEAMKMEHVVSAPRAGRIAELFVRAGDRVERGRLVARLEVVA
jgi:biotin carboxyl carrier protein